MQIVILAAGQGKRMRSSLPKVLQPIAGQPMLGHVLRTAYDLQANTVCVVYGHGGDQVRTRFAEDTQLAWAEQAEQLGTGHAVQQALPQLKSDEPVLILYGDVPLTRLETLQKLVAQTSDDKLALLTVHMDNPHGYGRIVRNAEGRVQCIVEEKDATDEQRKICEINTGILCAPARHLRKWLSRLQNNNAQGEYYLTDIIGMAVGDDLEIVTVQPGSAWETLGVNSKAQLAELERIHQRNIADALLDAGVTLIDPDRIDVRGALQCGRDVEIDINTVFEGQVELGDNVRIGANCVLKNARIAAGTKIAPFTHIEDAQVGPQCLIGPYARIRPGTVLGEDVHIGNFVEIKNSQIAAHSKANHLSYVGDADVGRQVNIGAGTITCNYDGANKHRTTIEDEVFIGSASQLVAPVRIGKGATLAAGTTLTKDAPAGQLTLSRIRQTSLQGWQRPTKKKN